MSAPWPAKTSGKASLREIRFERLAEKSCRGTKPFVCELGVVFETEHYLEDTVHTY